MVKNVIIIDNGSYGKGGTAQVAYASAVELVNRHIQVHFICADSKPNEELVKAGVKVYCVPSENINKTSNKLKTAFQGIWNFNSAKKISRILEKFDSKSTIIHIHGYLHCFSPSVLKACSKSGIKTVLTLHDYFTVCPCGGFYNYVKKSICKIKPMSFKCIFSNCDKRNYLQKIWRLIRQIGINRYLTNNKNISLIYISEFSYSKIKSHMNLKHNVYYVKNPYDVSIGELYNAYDNHDYIFLGRLSSEKGVDLFCHAFTNLIKNNQIKGKAIVIGDGEIRTKLEEKYPEIEFAGWKNHDELSQYMKNARALVFPSRWYETAGLTPIEAMSCGIPCIISDCSAAVEYIDKSPNGLIFQSDSIKSLKNEVLKAEDDIYWKKICMNNIEGFNVNDFSPVTHVSRLIEVYNQILK